MASTSITAYPDGPLVVRGPARLLDEHDRPIANRRRTYALCRCGRSRLMPFCDATHQAAGFRTGEPEACGAAGSA